MTELQRGDRVRPKGDTDPARLGTVYAVEIEETPGKVEVRWDGSEKRQAVEPHLIEQVEGYPLHDKLQANRAHAQTISAFLDWLGDQGLQLAEMKAYRNDHEVPMAEWDERGITGSLWPAMRKPESLIGGFLGISPEGLSAEKDLMYRRLIEIKEAQSG